MTLLCSASYTTCDTSSTRSAAPGMTRGKTRMARCEKRRNQSTLQKSESTVCRLVFTARTTLVRCRPVPRCMSDSVHSPARVPQRLRKGLPMTKYNRDVLGRHRAVHATGLWCARDHFNKAQADNYAEPCAEVRPRF